MGVGRKSLKGSFTLEAAMLSGLWLLTVFASLLLILGVHQRIYDTGKAYEAVIRRGTQAVCGTAEETVEQEEFWTAEDKEKIQVTFRNQLEIPFSDLKWIQEGRAERKIIRPVLFIEKVNVAGRLADNLMP